MVLDAVRETKLQSSRPTTIIITTEKTYLATWTKISNTRILPLSFKNLSKGHFCIIRENSISVSGYSSMLLTARFTCLLSPMLGLAQVSTNSMTPTWEKKSKFSCSLLIMLFRKTVKLMESTKKEI